MTSTIKIVLQRAWKDLVAAWSINPSPACAHGDACRSPAWNGKRSTRKASLSSKGEEECVSCLRTCVCLQGEVGYTTRSWWPQGGLVPLGGTFSILYHVALLRGKKKKKIFFNVKRLYSGSQMTTAGQDRPGIWQDTGHFLPVASPAWASAVFSPSGAPRIDHRW